MTSQEESLPEAGLLQDLTSPSARTVALSALISFSAIGFHATTTRHITEHASLSAGSLYTHFKSKEDILYYWMLCGHRSALAAARDALTVSGSPLLRISHVVQELTLWHIRYRTLSQLNTTQLRALDDEHYAVIRELRREIVECLRTPINDGVGSGLLHVSDVQLMMNALFAMVLDVSRWFPRDNSMKPQDVAAKYADFARALVLGEK